MDKFDIWNNLKKILSKKTDTSILGNKKLFKEGEIWWASIGYNLGEEVYGKGPNFRRPIIVFRKLTSSSCIAIPLTSKIKDGNWYHKFEMDGELRFAMMHQMRILSTVRFESRMSTMSQKDIVALKNAVGVFYNIF